MNGHFGCIGPPRSFTVVKMPPWRASSKDDFKVHNVQTLGMSEDTKVIHMPSGSAWEFCVVFAAHMGLLFVMLHSIFFHFVWQCLLRHKWFALRGASFDTLCGATDRLADSSAVCWSI